MTRGRILGDALRVTVSAALVLAASLGFSAAEISVSNASGLPGETVTVQVSLSGSGGGICALATDIAFDTGRLSFAGAAAGAAASAAGKQVVAEEVQPGTLRLGVYGMNQTPIPDGVVAELTFAIGSLAAGSVPLTPACSAANCAGGPVQPSCFPGSVTVGGSQCTLTCTATAPASATAGTSVALSATATPSNCSGSVTYAWTFGDGGTSSQQNPPHTYTSAGTFTWTMTASISGVTCVKSGNIVISGGCVLTCAASASPSSGDPPLSVAFTASATPIGCSWESVAPDPAVILKRLRRETPEEPGGEGATRSFGRIASRNPQDDAIASASTGSQDDSPSGLPGRNHETAIILSNNVPYGDSVAQDGWQFYSIAVPAGSQSLIVTTSNSTGDVDLYVLFGSEPTAGSWDYRAYTPSGDEIVQVTATSSPKPLAAGTWYIGVHGYAAASYAVTASVDVIPPSVTLLSSGVGVNGSIPDYTWKNYAIQVPTGATKLEVKTTNATADSDLYIRFGAIPHADDWDYRPYSTDGNETVTITPTSTPRPLQAGAWYITVHNIFAGSYTLTATITGGGPSCTLSCTATVPAAGTVGTPVAFASTATPSNCTGNPSFSWNFGDGQTSSLQNPSHTYAGAGTYMWSLSVSISGVICTKTGSIAIASSGGTTYSWTFGDGQTSTQQNPSHTYASAGAFPWTMTAAWNGKTCTQSGSVFCGVSPGKPGDCDGNGTVSIGEVQKAINMFLGVLAPGCGVDCNANATVSIGEVQKVINGFLGLAASC
jgi:PKD repeat protein